MPKQIIAAPVYSQTSHSEFDATSTLATKTKLLKCAPLHTILVETANSLTIQQWNGLAGA
jgi:hypothetical protein